MNGKEILNFLKLLYHTGCLSGYWKARVADIIQRIGGKV